MKQIIVTLAMGFSLTLFAQSDKKGGLDKIEVNSGIIYQKVTSEIGELPSKFYKSKVELLKVSPLNGPGKTSTYIVVEGTESIGNSYYQRSGVITIEQAKTLVKFLEYCRDSIVTRVPKEQEEVSIELSEDFSAAIFNSKSTTWSMAFRVHSYHKTYIFLKDNSIDEVITLFSIAIKKSELN